MRMKDGRQLHFLTKGTPFNDLYEGCAFGIRIGHYFQEKTSTDVCPQGLFFLFFPRFMAFNRQSALPGVVFCRMGHFAA